jgi:ATP-dependent DNA helicase RecG
MFTLFENPSIDNFLQEKEGQLFDRKGGRINWTQLTDVMIGFANADGGVIVLGIEKDKTITGVDDISIKTAEIRKAVLSQIDPPLDVNIKPLPCQTHKNENGNLLIIEVRQGSVVHSNLKGEVFLRIGDENMKLDHEQTTLLLDDRNIKSFELADARGTDVSDILTETFEEYKQTLGLPGIPSEDLLIGRDLARKEGREFIINMAGILLFGNLG